MAIRRDRCGSSVVIHRKSGYGSSNFFSSCSSSSDGIELKDEADASEGVDSGESETSLRADDRVLPAVGMLVVGRLRRPEMLVAIFGNRARWVVTRRSPC